jgi:hypoxanthine-guanine phosphoribosyltransferase
MADTVSRNETIETVFSAEDIAQRVGELAKAIAGQNLDPLLIVSVLNGSFVFADLVRACIMQACRLKSISVAVELLCGHDVTGRRSTARS